ncbi:thiamine phosphate synthase [Albibacterium indicum]|uniref:thiamine phosphate synthase n=1 Tax=Albibacterium indicum TaxID=2292082 RepID=UPI00130032AE|nr:thiamine phosphate synthase [Pedobacter indicus]
MRKKRNIREGVYLVIDPSMERDLLFERLEKAMKTRISAIQIWDNWQEDAEKETIIIKLIELCSKHDVPLLINNDWSLLRSFPLDGVHFDEIPANFDDIQRVLEASLSNKPIYGITCNNDMEIIHWADDKRIDYLSFCSMFPSTTSTSCELVSLESLHKARSITNLPIFLAGGIRPDNMDAFEGVDYQGVALISGIMGSNDPEKAVLQYIEQLNKN